MSSLSLRENIFIERGSQFAIIFTLFISLQEAQHASYLSQPAPAAGNFNFQTPGQSFIGKFRLTKNKKNQVSPRQEQSIILHYSIYVCEQKLDDQIFVSSKISGQTCSVQLSLLNGNIQGYLSISRNHRSFKIDIKPLPNKGRVFLQKEVKRLALQLEYHEKKENKQNSNSPANGQSVTRLLGQNSVGNLSIGGSSAFNLINSGVGFAVPPWQISSFVKQTTYRQQINTLQQRIVLCVRDVPFEEEGIHQAILEIPGGAYKYSEAHIQVVTQDNQTATAHSIFKVQVYNGNKKFEVEIQTDLFIGNINFQEGAVHIQRSQKPRERTYSQDRMLLYKGMIFEYFNAAHKTKKWLHKIKLDHQLSETTVGDYEDFKAHLDAELHQSKVIKNMQDEISSSSSEGEAQIALDSGDKKSRSSGTSENEIENFSPDFMQIQQQQQQEQHSQRVMALKQQSQKNIQDLGLEEERKSRAQNMDYSESVSAYEQEEQPLRNPQNANQNDQDTFEAGEQSNAHKAGLRALNQELEGYSQHRLSQDYKRIKSQLFKQEKENPGNLGELHLRHQVKSQSNNNLAMHFISMMTPGMPNMKQVSFFNDHSKRKLLFTNGESMLMILPEDLILRQYEFLYHYKWFKNNKGYYQLEKQRQEELERLRRLEEEEREREKQKEEMEHDLRQFQVIKEQIETFREFFRGPQQVQLLSLRLLCHDEFELNNDEYNDTKISANAYPLFQINMAQNKASNNNVQSPLPSQKKIRQQQNSKMDLVNDNDEIVIVLNKIQTDEFKNRQSRRSSSIKLTSFESLILLTHYILYLTFQLWCIQVIVNQNFLDRLGLIYFNSLPKVHRRLDDFIKSQPLQEIVRFHINQLLIERQMQTKTFEGNGAEGGANQLGVNAQNLRKMDSEMRGSAKSGTLFSNGREGADYGRGERTNSIVTRGYDNRTSSEYGDTSMNDSYSKYLK